jgi:hypothetical protein
MHRISHPMLISPCPRQRKNIFLSTSRSSRSIDPRQVCDYSTVEDVYIDAGCMNWWHCPYAKRSEGHRGDDGRDERWTDVDDTMGKDQVWYVPEVALNPRGYEGAGFEGWSWNGWEGKKEKGEVGECADADAGGRGRRDRGLDEEVDPVSPKKSRGRRR